MKNILKSISIAAVCLFSLTACNDEFMERAPLSVLSDATFWRSETDLQIYLNQFYQALGAAYYVDEDCSDNAQNKTKDKFLWSTYTVTSTSTDYDKTSWEQIRNVNYFFSHFHKAYQTVPEEIVNQFLGEASFFKAYFYFSKVKKFGDVIWMSNDPNVDSEELYSKQTNRRAVIDSCCVLLDNAAKYLPEESSKNRLNRYAALALKARMCLFEGTYEKYHGLNASYAELLEQGRAACEEIMNSGKFELKTTRNSDHPEWKSASGWPYHDFFTQEDMAGCKEAIFYVEYAEGQRSHTNAYNYMNRKSGFVKDFIDCYLCTDGLPISISPLYKGDLNYKDEFENRDPRMYVTVYHPDYPCKIDDKGTATYYTVPNYSTSNPTGYRMFKIVPFDAMLRNSNNCNQDVAIFRYGEVLINYAEIMAELDKCTQEVLDKTVNTLRARVGFSAKLTVNVGFTDPKWPAWEVPVTPLINEIRRERRVELVSEGFRWNDLCRWKAGKLIENPMTYLGARKKSNQDYFDFYTTTERGSRKWNDRMYLYPYPFQELILNPNLVQNPGWESLGE